MRSFRPSPLARPDVERLWIEAAGRLGLRVERGGSAYAASDGRGTLTIGVDESLDEDDAVAQLVFHELCHAATEGPAHLREPDWGLDNVTTRDTVREHGCLRFSAHVAGRHGLRELLAPTTDYRPYHDALPADPLADDGDPAVPIARQALVHLGEMGWADVIDEALRATAALLRAAPLPSRDGADDAGRERGAGPAVPSQDGRGIAAPAGRQGEAGVHPAGLPWGDPGRTCGGCAWFHEGGRGRAVTRCWQGAAATGDGPRVDATMRACARWEPPVDCRTCGACCREAYHSVTVPMRDPVVWKHPELVTRSMRRFEIRREGGRCAALHGGGGDTAPFTCAIYEDRPQPCREFTAGGRHCLTARRRVGLSAG